MKGVRECPRCVRDDADLDDTNLDLVCDMHLDEYREELEERAEYSIENAWRLREWNER